MNDSETYYEINRALYKHKITHSHFGEKSSILSNYKIFKQRPAYITKRAMTLAFSDTKKLVETILGRRQIKNYKDIRKKLDANYNSWINNYERKAFKPDIEKKTIQKFKVKPLISLITPVFNPPIEALQQLIESLLSQTYSNFEFLLFDFGDSIEVVKLLEYYAKYDNRIKIKTGLENKGISENSNLILKHTEGEYVGLIDHDDLVEPNLLFECVKAINNTDPPIFIYTDKDKITERNVRYDPQLKPDFSPELLLTANYLTHFDLIKKDMVLTVGGWDKLTDGAQDWDLFLKITEKTNKIVHIPKILYHWRTVKNSTANHIDVKPYVRKAQQLTINRALKRRRYSDATAYQGKDGQMYVKWARDNQKVAYFIHGIFLTQHIEKLLNNIIDQPDYHNESTIYYFVLNDDLKLNFVNHLEKKYKNLKIIKYNAGSFIPTFIKQCESIPKDIESCIYLSDSVKKVNSNYGYWISQITGWLNTEDIAVVSAKAEYNSMVIDCGSVYDKPVKRFIHLFTGSISDFDLIGYSQWTRNLLVPSKRINAFKPDLVFLIKKLIKNLNHLRDDEIALLIGLSAIFIKKRVVYDASVNAEDEANFILQLDLSKDMSEFMEKHTEDVIIYGDPYLNKSVVVKRVGLALREATKQAAVNTKALQLIDF